MALTIAIKQCLVLKELEKTMQIGSGLKLHVYMVPGVKIWTGLKLRNQTSGQRIRSCRSPDPFCKLRKTNVRSFSQSRHVPFCSDFVPTLG
mmetsp:Transcript_17724/g.31006  ORF Transcript_17724/g.31006 Transcript_17724/m.31006 type:complete len:91 (-) Transcript_17724:111-383(-)